MSIGRDRSSMILQALDTEQVVAILGPRQVGKTTLAVELVSGRSFPHVYLDLELPSDAKKLSEAELFLKRHFGEIAVLDEIQRQPELFPLLRSLVDLQTRQGNPSGHYLVLGSSSLELLRQSSESLAGRITYIELSPFTVSELEHNESFELEKHWLRGGFPRSYLAKSDEVSLQWRENFIRTYLERDIPQLGLRLPAEQLRRFWSMLGYSQGDQLNAAKLAGSLGVSANTIRKYLDLLTDLFMVRQLRPWSGNSTKRLVKSPKIYVRDSGLLHALLSIPEHDVLLSHPQCGGSWEGYVIENLCANIPKNWKVSYYRTSAQAEIDLVLETPRKRIIAIDIKRTLSPSLSKGFKFGLEDIGATDSFYVIPYGERFPLSANTDAISLPDMVQLLNTGKLDTASGS